MQYLDTTFPTFTGMLKHELEITSPAKSALIHIHAAQSRGSPLESSSIETTNLVFEATINLFSSLAQQGDGINQVTFDIFLEHPNRTYTWITVLGDISEGITCRLQASTFRNLETLINTFQRGNNSFPLVNENGKFTLTHPNQPYQPSNSWCVLF